MKKRKISSHYKEWQAPVEFASTDEHFLQFFYLSRNITYIETHQAMEMLLLVLKALHGKDFDREL